SLPLPGLLDQPRGFLLSRGCRHTRFSRDWSADVCSSDLLDTTITADIPGVPDDATVTKLRHGAAIKVFDSSQLPTRKLVQHLRRSEEHTSELQSRENLVCRLLLEKKK